MFSLILWASLPLLVVLCGIIQINIDEYDLSDQEDVDPPEELEEVATEEHEEDKCMSVDELVKDQLEAINDVNSIFEVTGQRRE